MPVVSTIYTKSMRDQEWLEKLFSTIWEEHFHDVEARNPIRVEFGRRAKRRLGSISLDRSDHKLSIIRVNGLFKSPDIPEMIVKATLVHELCHYAHGFNSGGEQRHRHPHAGGVMRAEFAERGLEDLYQAQKQWLKANWPVIVKKNFPPTRYKRRPAKYRLIFFNR